MKYKRRRSRVAKYVPCSEGASSKKNSKRLKRRSITAIALVAIPFFAVRFNFAQSESLKSICVKSREAFDALSQSKLLTDTGDCLAEFCLEYLRGNELEKTEAHASEPVKAVSKELDAPLETKPPQNEAEKIFSPIMPCEGDISSYFGSREHPINGENTFHNGIDIAASEGTPVKAADDGQVIKSEYNDYSGHHVIIQHADGYTSSYAHMRDKGIAAGLAVKKGEVIGYVGSTGAATGPHLHLEIRQGGTPLDPYKLIAG